MAELHLIVGPMFSGKTSRLINIANLSKIEGKKIFTINYKNDTRYSNKDKIVTHDGLGMDCFMVGKNIMSILDKNDYLNSEIVLINESQFFENLLQFCLHSLGLNKTIFVSGLNGDSNMESFGEIDKLIPNCDTITHLNSRCSLCGNLAPFTKRIVDNNDKELIGSGNYYMPTCRSCYYF